VEQGAGEQGSRGAGEIKHQEEESRKGSSDLKGEKKAQGGVRNKKGSRGSAGLFVWTRSQRPNLCSDCLRMTKPKLTYRDHVQAILRVSGHSDDGKKLKSKRQKSSATRGRDSPGFEPGTPFLGSYCVLPHTHTHTHTQREREVAHTLYALACASSLRQRACAG
jgi:hypothetical protein